jgi:uncharacterized Zn finger protein
MTATAPSLGVQTKAGRYLLERRVRVKYAEARTFAAVVTGSKPYGVTFNAVQGWLCGCPAAGTCCHIVACQAVWAPAAPPPGSWDAADPFTLLPEAE